MASSTPAPAQALMVGSKNVAIADPVVPRPPTTPCTVTLFANQQFTDYSAKPFSYAPPSNCAGPWQKVVLSIDFNLSGTRQFDRSAQMWLGGAIVYFGTTQEPLVAPPDSTKWHVERDLTDYSALFTANQVGHTDLGNFVGTSGGVTYNGIITGTATLSFYPVVGGVRQGALQPRPDAVLSLNASATNGLSYLHKPGDQFIAKFSALPTNIERAFLDVYAQGQSDDEFWYFNLPNDIAGVFGDNTGTALRETLVLIDGQPAGIAPIFPWVFTGGADPILWRPTPGVQTLAFEAFRVDLTPFAGVLSDGKPHALALSVYNSTNYFAVGGNLLMYLDHGGNKVTGSVTSNTLAAQPTVNVNENVTVSPDGSTASGTVAVTSNRSYAISGTVNTSHGTVTTQVAANIAFSSNQNLQQTSTTYVQDAVQNTQIDLMTTRNAGGNTTVVHEQRAYPFTFKYEQVPTAAGDGSYTLYTYVDQEFAQQVAAPANGYAVAVASRDNHVISTVTRNYNAAGSLVSAPAASVQLYTYFAPFGACYSRQIASQNRVLSSWQDGGACLPGVNTLSWRDQYSQAASSAVGSTVQLLP
ncbi:MAG: peptide-N(4)-(N-acetyl-beta-glucosaminyl)asparagine amidase [Proteobacteria bacterium]|nr:peptide-N(4)-(N-acetyl-beta-glucosaminyl)asparagine amidase [Pseudomonadota bacterium]